LFLDRVMGQAGGMSESIDPEDVVSYDDVRDQHDRERDGVASLHDAEGEQGDEAEVTDRMDLDQDEATELEVGLDRLGGETPRLD
jgi:hypothetical protein